MTKKGRSMINKLFKDKKKRYLNLVLILLPFVILMGIFGFAAFKSAKGISNNVGGEVAFSNSIDTMDYHLRANATDYQKELFKELQGKIIEYLDNFYLDSPKNED